MCEHILNYKKYNYNNSAKDSQGHSSVICCILWKAEEASLETTSFAGFQGTRISSTLKYVPVS